MTFTLTRAEAVAIGSILLYTSGDVCIALDATSPAGVEAEIRRLRLEGAIRDDAGWWDRDSPGLLDLHEQLGEGTCPDTFTLPADAARALAELLPIAFGDTLDEDVETVLAVADRLGVEIPQPVA